MLATKVPVGVSAVLLLYTAAATLLLAIATADAAIQALPVTDDTDPPPHTKEEIVEAISTLLLAQSASASGSRPPPRTVRSAPLHKQSPHSPYFHVAPNPFQFGKLGVADPPNDLVQHTVQSNVLYERIGRTAPAVGYAHIRLDINMLELIIALDKYEVAIRAISRTHNVCSVQRMFRNNSSPVDFNCTHVALKPHWRTLHLALSDHFHSYVGFRAETQVIRDIFRPLSILLEDFIQERGPNEHWREDLKQALMRSPDERSILGVLFAGSLGAAITQLLWSFFTPSEAQNTAHLAVVAEHSLTVGENLQTAYSTITELGTAVDALASVIDSRDSFDTMISRLNLLRQAVSRRLQGVRALLDSAAAGKMSSAAFLFFNLRKAADDIHSRAKELSMAPISQSFVEVLSSDCNLFQSEEGFSVVCHIPLLRQGEDGVTDELDIYQLADLPISLSPTLQLRVAPRIRNFLAISSLTGQWRTMSASDLYSCSKLGTFFLCPLSGVLRTPLPDTADQFVSDDSCLYHLYTGQFRGAAATCNAAVDQKQAGVTQTGPFSFAAYAPEPILGEATCPSDPSFRRTLLIQNLTAFSLPPSCKMKVGSYWLYPADSSFNRESDGTRFSYPYPQDILSGNVSESDLTAIRTSVAVALTLAEESRVDQWQKNRRHNSLLSSAHTTSFQNSLLIAGLFILLTLLTAFLLYCLCRIHRRIQFLESSPLAPLVLTPQRPRRGATARLPLRYPSLTPAADGIQAAIPLLPQPPPARPASSAITIRNGQITADGPGSNSSPPPYPKLPSSF